MEYRRCSVDLSCLEVGVSLGRVKEKWNSALPLVLMLVFALTRWPGMLPENFSAAYALAFCAGVYFPRRSAWWLPLGTLVVTDVLINLYYLWSLNIDSFKVMQLANYLAYALIIWLGTKFSVKSGWAKLLGGGMVGAVLFYLITNTASWLFNPFHNPEYTKDLAGWITALTKGTAGWPQTWEFFRNTLFSGGLFTGLFAGAMKVSGAVEAKEEEPAEAKAEEDTGGAKPEEAKA